MVHFRLVLILILAFAGACSQLPLLQETAVPTSTPTAPPSPTPGITPTPEEMSSNLPVTLRIWLPPEFDPASGSEAGDLLQARLNDFAARQPLLRLDIRIKEIHEPGKILDAISASAAAAPTALPDLIALPRPVLEEAALKGLLYPFDGLTSSLEDPNWFEYAQQMARLQNSTFGLPFAGDALILVYRPEVIPEPPKNWTESIEIPRTLAFPAADPHSLYTLNLYLAGGGAVQDDQGRPILESNHLAEIFEYYQLAQELEPAPTWLTQTETFQHAWTAYVGQEADMAAVWATQYFMERPADTTAALIPTANGAPYTLATGWVWAMANGQTQKHELAVQLAEFLTEPSFLSRWNAAAGFLPPHSAALTGWFSSSDQAFARQLQTSAQLVPSSDILSSIGSPLKVGTLQSLRVQGAPLLLAEEAVHNLQNP
jgi:multiple sugar transport system substrate-binding protein